ncbi:MAG: hypothetical protein RBR28_00195 [Lentimicrobium sp.]|jgi:hypothetical protein|nr:hypothetical protein [Lentimicrobium sp.]
MKTNYFSKIEDKYVFNFSLIFWHLFIALSSLAIVISVLVFIWSVIPPLAKKVEKQAYPEKQQLPAPVAVLLSEITIDDADNNKVYTSKTTYQKKAINQAVETSTYASEDTLGKKAYDETIQTLEKLIPPSKYSWSGAGYWYYPYGERYWNVYKDERYRNWIVTEYGLKEKLDYAYRTSDAPTYTDKKHLLDAYITVLQQLPEDKRKPAINSLVQYCSKSKSQNINVCTSLSKVIPRMDNENNLRYMDLILDFGKRNPNDGSPFIDYVSEIIDKFDSKERINTISLFMQYFYAFNEDLPKLQEATDLFIPLLTEIKGENHNKSLSRYYDIFMDKNRDREIRIAQIDEEYAQQIERIDNQYVEEKALAAMQFEGKKIIKTGLRSKSLAGIGGGIFLIVLIGTLLVFLSIQRSVRKIEEKISMKNDI